MKPKDRKEGVEQIHSYMAACVNCEFGMWTNGSEWFCFRPAEFRSQSRRVGKAALRPNGRKTIRL